jgi:hypothetical protein
MMRWQDPTVLLKVYAHSRPQKRQEAQDLIMAAMGLNESTVHWIE